MNAGDVARALALEYVRLNGKPGMKPEELLALYREAFDTIFNLTGTLK